MKTRTLIGTVLTALLVGVCACTESTDVRTQQAAVTAEQFEPGRGLNLGGGSRRGIEVGRSTGREEMSSFLPAEIASIMLVLNEGEVAQAKIAQERARSESVRRFARLMVEDHSRLVDRLQSGSLERLGASKSDTTARILARHGQLITRDLETQSEDLFDLAYMTSQVAAHAELLGLIDAALLPGGGQRPRQVGEEEGQPYGQVQQEQQRGEMVSEELTRELMQTRDLVSRHLEQALRIHAELRRAAISGERGTHGEHMSR